MPTDAELLQAYTARGDNTAFRELVDRYIDLVFSTAVRQVGGDVHLARDVTQQVFTALAKAGKKLGDRDSLAGWLYTTSRYASAQTVRSERRRKIREQVALSINENPPSRDGWEQLTPWLETAMDQLRDTDREAIVLRFFQNKTHRSIGQELQLSEEAARKKVDRALEKLRVLLQRRGIPSSSAAVALLLESQPASGAPADLASAIYLHAIAGAGQASAATVGFFPLMSTAKFIAAAAALAAVFCAGIATREIRALHSTRFERDRTQASIRGLRQQREETERAAAEEERQFLALQMKRAARTKTNPSAFAKVFAEGDALPAGVINPIQAGQDFVKAHPEAPRLLANYNRYRWLDRYSGLFSKLALSPTQIDQFLAIMTHADAGVGWQSRTQVPMVEFNADDQGVTRDERNARLRALMGETGFRAFEEYDRSYSARQPTAQLAELTYSTPNAPTKTQMDLLAEIFAQTSPDFMAGRTLSISSVNWDHALAGAQAILSAAQLVALTAVREQNEFQEKLKEAANAAERAAIDAAVLERKSKS